MKGPPYKEKGAGKFRDSLLLLASPPDWRQRPERAAGFKELSDLSAALF